MEELPNEILLMIFHYCLPSGGPLVCRKWKELFDEMLKEVPPFHIIKIQEKLKFGSFQLQNKTIGDFNTLEDLAIYQHENKLSPGIYKCRNQGKVFTYYIWDIFVGKYDSQFVGLFNLINIHTKKEYTFHKAPIVLQEFIIEADLYNQIMTIYHNDQKKVFDISSEHSIPPHSIYYINLTDSFHISYSYGPGCSWKIEKFYSRTVNPE